MAEIEKLDLKTKNIMEEQREKLKALFPEVFTEGHKIDFDKLKMTLGEDVDTGEERFGMIWPGKKECFKVIQEPSIATLKPCKEESVNWDTTENLFIEGDNLEVLKQLQRSYYGKVKMIYIDPPYNTGNEFIYPDKFSESLDTYLAYTGQVDNEGRKFSTNSDTDGRFHSKWMNMIYPRLYLAKNLLKEDGVVFISIDDNELLNLKKICDEIFGEECFVANIIWEKRTTRENRRYFSVRHDYVLMYAKDGSKISEIVDLLPMDQAAIDRYKNPDNDPRGDWTSVPAIAQAGHGTKNQFYTLTTPSGRKIDPPSGSCWRYTQNKMNEEIGKNNLWFGKDGNGVPRIKKFLNEGRQGLTPETIWWSKDVGTNDSAKRDLVTLFEGKATFETPKPTQLIERMLDIGSNKEAIVLDFFSGCAPTAEAVININARDGGSRKFLVIQLPETCEKESEAFRAGFKTIADIGKDRIRRIIKKIEEEQSEQQKQAEGDLFKKEELKKEPMDLGFKVFKLSQSNFKIWDGKADKDLESQISMAIDHVSPKSSKEDILYEILLKSGYELTTKIDELKIQGKTVYSIAEGALLICLEDKLTKELIRAIAEKEPARVVVLDSGFNENDQLKTNAVQIMKSFHVESFRTV